MLKKIVALSLVMTLVIPSLFISYAETEEYCEMQGLERKADVVEDVTGTEDIVNELVDCKDSYISAEYGDAIEIPKEGDSSAEMSLDENTELEMNLPEEVDDAEGVLTDDGTVIYDSEAEDVAIALQVLSGECCGFRSMITIENMFAPNEYSFEMDLPDGYMLVRDYDYDDGLDEYDCGDIYVINSSDDVICTIEKAWAIDSEGNDVESEYVIDGNVLTQKVYFDEEDSFPIIADPAIISYKTVDKLMTLSEVRTERNKYTTTKLTKLFATGFVTIVGTSAATTFICYSAGVVTAVPSTVVAVGVGTLVLAGTTYKAYKYSTWDNVYTGLAESGKKRALVTFKFRWSSTLEGYAQYGKVTASYTNQTKF